MTGVPGSLSTGDKERLGAVDRARDKGRIGIPALVQFLTDASWVVRRRAIAALAELGDAAIPSLCGLLRDGRDNETRIAAVVDALATSSGDVDAAILPLADDENPAVVADVAQILGRRRSVAGVTTLARLSAAADDNVAVAAIEGLGKVGGRAAVDPLLAAVASRSFFRAFPAIDVLGRSGDPRAVEALAPLVGDSRYALEAARALGKTADRLAAAPLATVLVHPSDSMVRVACVAIADLCDRFAERYGLATPIERAIAAAAGTAAVRRITEALGGASTSEQTAMCRVLGAIGNDAAIGQLTSLLDAAPPVSRAAAGALKVIGRGADAQVLQALREGDSQRRLLLLPLVSTRAAGVSDVLGCLEDPDGAVRAAACDALARIGAPETVPAIFRLLDDPNGRVVQAAVAAIQSLGSPTTEALSLEAARSPSARVRREAYRIVAYFGYRSALALLIDAATREEGALRDAAIHALAFVEDDAAIDTILAARRDEDPRTRAASMRALGNVERDPRAPEALLAALGDDDAWVRYYAAQSLGRLRHEPAADGVAALLSDPAGQVRVAAIEALAHFRDERSLAALVEATSSTDADIRRAALVGLGLRKLPSTVPHLLEATRASDAATRLVAVSALAEISDPRVVPALAAAAMDADTSVRDAAVDLLGRRREPEATAALVDLVRVRPADARIAAALDVATEERTRGVVEAIATADDDLALRLASALARMSRPGIDALVGVLASSSLAARKAAAATLAGVGTQAALDALRLAAGHDPDPEVRRICAVALGT